MDRLTAQDRAGVAILTLLAGVAGYFIGSSFAAPQVEVDLVMAAPADCSTCGL